jgi:hypothetical protein
MKRQRRRDLVKSTHWLASHARSFQRKAHPVADVREVLVVLLNSSHMANGAVAGSDAK